MNLERTYLIIPASYVSQIDFNTVCETSAETLRYNVDNTMTFIKWDNEQPECTKNIEGCLGPYTHSEILEILSGPDWSPEVPVV